MTLFLLLATYLLFIRNNFAYMTLDEITDTVNDIKTKIEDVKQKYGAKIAKLDKQLNDVRTNAENHSKQFIKDTQDKIQIEIQKVTSNMQKEVNKIETSMNAWMETQKEKLIDSKINALASKLGISPEALTDTVKDTLKKLVK